VEGTREASIRLFRIQIPNDEPPALLAFPGKAAGTPDVFRLERHRPRIAAPGLRAGGALRDAECGRAVNDFAGAPTPALLDAGLTTGLRSGRSSEWPGRSLRRPGRSECRRGSGAVRSGVSKTRPQPPGLIGARPVKSRCRCARNRQRQFTSHPLEDQYPPEGSSASRRGCSQPTSGARDLRTGSRSRSFLVFRPTLRAVTARIVSKSRVDGRHGTDATEHKSGLRSTSTRILRRLPGDLSGAGS
jgi:hypothetical protein